MEGAIVGLIVNPIAGMGGRVGLKGTDGSDVLEEALKRGAHPVAAGRAIRALLSLKRSLPSTRLLTCRGKMGENEAVAAQFPHELLQLPTPDQRTSAADTRTAAKLLEERGVRLLLFAGGDGTARDISQVVDARIAAVGIPCGVKNFSAVFATSPEAAGEVAASYLRGEVATLEREVLDYDMEQMRIGAITTKMFGSLNVPSSRRFMQGAKSPSYASDEEEEQEAIAKFIVEEMRPDLQYILGPGSTTRKIAHALNLEKTILSVDVIFDKRLIAKDTTGRELEELVEGRATKAIVSPIGGQGYILGRGNQQLTPSVIRKIGKENIMVVCTRSKLLDLPERRFLVDTGDRMLDNALRGYWRIIVGYREFAIVKVEW
jgi:predicted polyphosphate/ATP-dependent NAD kinase